MLLELREEGTKLPFRIGFYEAVDEEPRSFMSKLGRKTINPEYDFGMRKSDLSQKEILRGNRHPKPDTLDGDSQLKNIIRYMRAPMKKAERKQES